MVKKFNSDEPAGVSSNCGSGSASCSRIYLDVSAGARVCGSRPGSSAAGPESGVRAAAVLSVGYQMYIALLIVRG